MLVLWYNPVMGLALLEQSGSTSHLLQSLSSSVELMTQKKGNDSRWRRCRVRHR